MYLLGLISGIVLMIGLYFLNSSIKNKFSKKSKYRRNGLYTANFQRGSGEGYEVSVEIGEIERNKTKSKIEIVGNIKASTSLSTISRKQITEIIEGWVDSDSAEIEWFKEHPNDVRADKIDQVLN